MHLKLTDIRLHFSNKIKTMFRKISGQSNKSDGWFGNYTTWEEALSNCTGYNDDIILSKVRESILKVKNDEAVYERDSVLFDELQFSQPVIDAFSSSIKQSVLHVTDFGGSLGGSYFQHRSLLKSLQDLRWSVVEQKHFVDCGKKEIEFEKLKFTYTIAEALKMQQNQVLFLSSVIQYFKAPYVLIQQLLEYNFEHIIIDRNAFIEGESERITKQIVPEHIYKASYPAWFLNEKKFRDAFETKYQLINSFDSAFEGEEKLEDGKIVYWKGFHFKIKEAHAV